MLADTSPSNKIPSLVHTAQEDASDEDLRLLDMMAAIIQNFASHPDNRTRLYKAELKGTTALDRLIEGPASPEPTDTATALTATRNAQGRSSPAPSSRCASPSTVLPRLGSGAKDTTGFNATNSSTADSTQTLAATLRPKVVFPPIAVRGVPGDEAGPSSNCAENDELMQLISKRGVMSRSRTSFRSNRPGTSMMGQPGSPTAVAPDNREQFLIWLDSTFADVAAEGGGGGADNLDR